MKAMVYHNYGSPDVLDLEEIEKPTPGDDEVLVKVYAAATNAGTWHLLRGEPFPVRLMFGFSKPKQTVLGSELAGRVEAVGKNITQFKPGDEVFGDSSGHAFGAFAEYVTVPEQLIAHKPASISFAEAAASAGSAVTALQGLRDHGQIKAGQQVLVNGASGGVGSFAVQIAKSYGAEVTGVAGSAKVEMVRSLGADHVIDYSQEDVTRGSKRYDLIIDAAAFRSIFDFKRILKPGGRYVMIGGSGGQLLQVMLLGPLASMTGGQKMGNMMTAPNQQDLQVMAGLLESGKVKPVIDRSFPLDQLPDAIRYVEGRRVQGKVVIAVDSEE
jgi:NADPH:quinone reductase-like Zn-dependent oxidoreductase